MTENNQDFSKARVGDSVWSARHGYGEILEVNASSEYAIYAVFEGDLSARFSLDGKYYFSDKFPILYWSKPEIIAPPPPKRTKKVWIGGFWHDDAILILNGNRMTPKLYATKEDAEAESTAFVAEVEIEDRQ